MEGHGHRAEKDVLVISALDIIAFRSNTSNQFGSSITYAGKDSPSSLLF